MALWCQDLHAVRLPRGDTPTPVTFVYPYYENAGFFATQLERWRHYPADLAASLSIVVVDDGSPRAGRGVPRRRRARSPASVPDRGRPAMELARRPQHRRALRGPGWLLLTDMDHVVTRRRSHDRRRPHDPALVYAFPREDTRPDHRAALGQFPPDARSVLDVGGYDETLAATTAPMATFGGGRRTRRSSSTRTSSSATSSSATLDDALPAETTSGRDRPRPHRARGRAGVRRCSFPYREVSP